MRHLKTLQATKHQAIKISAKQLHIKHTTQSKFNYSLYPLSIAISSNRLSFEHWYACYSLNLITVYFHFSSSVHQFSASVSFSLLLYRWSSKFDCSSLRQFLQSPTSPFRTMSTSDIQTWFFDFMAKVRLIGYQVTWKFQYHFELNRSFENAM